MTLNTISNIIIKSLYKFIKISCDMIDDFMSSEKNSHTDDEIFLEDDDVFFEEK